jgi:hypothetical protein
MTDSPDFQKTVVVNSTPSGVMPGPDSPDWQETVQLVNSAQSDVPDWQQYIVGPGGTPIVPAPARQAITRIADWSTSSAASGTTLTLAVNPVNIGDLLMCSAAVFQSNFATGISGGGVTTWTLVTSGSEFNTAEAVYQWQGVVTASGPSTITVTISNTGNWILMATELNTPLMAPQWYVYGSTWKGAFSVSTYAFVTPALTPQGSNEMYLAWVATGTGGMTMPGFTFGGGTLVMNTGTFANYAGVATMPNVAYPTNYEFIVNGVGNTDYDEIACLIYATS